MSLSDQCCLIRRGGASLEEMEAMEEAKSASSLSEHSSIKIISKSIVYPHHPSTLRRLNLSVFDLRMIALHYIQKGLLFTQPTFSSSDVLINHLRFSLSRALSFYPPLAGRLSTDPDGSFFVTCNDAGVEFVHAAAPGLSLSDVVIRDSDVPDVVKELFLFSRVHSFDGASSFRPLFAVQVTELVDGVFVGCSVNHGLVDGTSLWNFFNAWSELCRGVEKISRPPDFHRGFLKDPPPVPCLPVLIGSSPAPTIRDRVFHFSRAAIIDLKARANSFTGATNGEISSFQSVCALLWRSVTRARKLSSGKETSFRMAANCRHRLEPPLRTHYFGNAIMSVVTVAKVEEVVEREVGWCAELLRRNVAAFGDEKVRKEVEEWEEKRKPTTLGSFDGSLLAVASSPRFPVYENDMGWGRPVVVLSGAANKVDGGVSAFPGWEGGGTIDLEVCLAPETMARLELDEEFMQYVGADNWFLPLTS